MKTFLRSLLTRKFLLALGATITLIANGAYTEAVATVVAYLAAEGAVDAAQNLGNKTIITKSGDL